MRVVTLTLCIILTLVTRTAQSQEALHQTFGITYTDQTYAKALTEYVDDQGLVNYEALKENRQDLDDYIRDVAGLYTDIYDDWNNDKRLVYWLNAYNAMTLAAITDNYPIKTDWKAKLLYPTGIRHIKGVWKNENHMAKGTMVSLDHIEHQEVRPVFKDPRVHMALVCAAKGCPTLRNEPYVADKLDEQLADQARTFLADPLKFRINDKKGVVYLSSIFEWFGEDFLEGYGDKESVTWGSPIEQAVMAFIGEHLEEAEWDKLRKNTYTVKYLDYDWSLNEQ